MRIRNEALYTFIRWLVRNTFFRAVASMRVVDENRVPPDGGLIIAPNHISHADPPAVSCAMRRKICFMAKEELFRGPFGKLISALGAFPVKRGEGDTEAVRLTMSLLERGEAVLVFPEGTRGDGEAFQPVNRGVGMLAKRTGAKVVPVAIVGTEKVLPRGSSKPHRHKIVLAFGEPFTYADTSMGANDRENRELFAAELTRRILALCGEQGMPLKTSSSTEPTPAYAVAQSESEAPDSPRV
jgi:1-acyl-sn-glycerol-3-phosphate acyltransferase